MDDWENAKKGTQGLYLVAKPSEVIDSKKLIDIVAVHGLNGHCLDTWTCHDVLWLRDLLPKEMPNARVMTYQYDSKVISNNYVYSVSDSARHLVQTLRDYRDDEVFFGTPHRGADPAKMLGPIVKAVAAARFRPSSKCVEMLKTHSEELLQVSQDFRPFASQYALVSFYEQHIHPGLRTVVVDKMSAVMGFPHEDRLMLGGTHSSMCKFTRSDPRFNSVWKHIQRAAVGPPRRRVPLV
ncbi:hypothetical protein DL765_004095 [Monosporascus sp. GIB2]|nr:hypothetical protein DL765_004095 [Monosporascus sp. GIB2]